MIELTERPQFSVTIPPKLLQEGYLVTFPDTWPSTMNHIRGKTFRIEATNQVPYPLPYKIPTGDYKDVDLSNNSDGEKLYPTNAESLFEISMGLSIGNYVVHFYIPQGKSINQLEYAGMYPDLSSATLRYLGAKQPKDSPADDPRIKLYFPMDTTPMIIRPYVLPGVDYEKVVVTLIINKCRLQEIEPTQEQLNKAKVLRYYSELRW